MRLIDADALKKSVLDLHDCYNGFSDTYDKACIIGVIDEEPTIEPKKGKWIGDGESRREYPYKCSECGEIDYYAFLYDSDTREYKQQDNFCPNCGADMRGD